MSRFIVTYWTGATQSFDTETIEEAASLAGYSAESEVTHGIHIWNVTPGEYVEVTNSDGDLVAKIEADIYAIVNLLDSNPWDSEPDSEIPDGVEIVYPSEQDIDEPIDWASQTFAVSEKDAMSAAFGEVSFPQSKIAMEWFEKDIEPLAQWEQELLGVHYTQLEYMD